MNTKTYDLHDYDTGEYIRPATANERADSTVARALDGGNGIILVPDQGERRVCVL